MKPTSSRARPVIAAAVAVALLAACGATASRPAAGADPGSAAAAHPASAHPASAQTASGHPAVGHPARTHRAAASTPAELLGASVDQVPLPNLPADCVPRIGNPYQVGAIGTFYDGTLNIGTEASVDHISGSFCAVATVVPPPPGAAGATVCVAAVVPADGLHFPPVSANITIIPGVTTVVGHVTVAAHSVTATLCNNEAPGPIVVHTTVSAAANAHVLGANCGVTASVAVVGTVQGPLDDPEQGATGVAVDDPAKPFSVPALVPTPTCPSGLTTAGNGLLGLPTPPGEAHLKILVRVTAYIRL